MESFKRRLSWILVVVMLSGLLLTVTSCSQVKVDYKNAESYEEALNDGEDTVGKTVRFTVDNYIPDGALGYTIWSGDHLNFISYTDPGCEIGDTMTVEVTKVYNILGHWIIYYDSVDSFRNTHETSEIEGNLPGTYFGINGSIMVLHTDGKADYYWSGWDVVDTFCSWSAGDGVLFVTIPSCFSEVRADISDSAGFYLEGATESDQELWDPEYFVKISDDTNTPTIEECQEMIRENRPAPTPVVTDLAFVERTYIGLTVPIPEDLSDFERTSNNGEVRLISSNANNSIGMTIQYIEVDPDLLDENGFEDRTDFLDVMVEGVLAAYGGVDITKEECEISGYTAISFDSAFSYYGNPGRICGLALYIEDNSRFYVITIMQSDNWNGEDYLVARDYILQNANYNQT